MPETIGVKTKGLIQNIARRVFEKKKEEKSLSKQKEINILKQCFIHIVFNKHQLCLNFTNNTTIELSNKIETIQRAKS